MYFVLYTHKGDTKLRVLQRANEQPVGAEEGNQHLLEMMAKQLQRENLIGEWFLVKRVV